MGMPYLHAIAFYSQIEGLQADEMIALIGVQHGDPKQTLEFFTKVTGRKRRDKEVTGVEQWLTNPLLAGQIHTLTP